MKRHNIKELAQTEMEMTKGFLRPLMGFFGFFYDLSWFFFFLPLDKSHSFACDQFVRVFLLFVLRQRPFLCLFVFLSSFLVVVNPHVIVGLKFRDS